MVATIFRHEAVVRAMPPMPTLPTLPVVPWAP
jgi:hypothetical protein